MIADAAVNDRDADASAIPTGGLFDRGADSLLGIVSQASDGAVGRNVENVRIQRQLRSEEHTSELQSLRHLVCRLLLEKKKSRDYASTQKREYTTLLEEL